MSNLQILLASRPRGEPTLDNFRLAEAPLPEVPEGHVLVRNHFLSLDPYMRGRMNEGKSYTSPQELNTVMGGSTVGEVIASKDPAFTVGDKVVCGGEDPDFTVSDKVVRGGGWQLFSLLSVRDVHKVDATHVPLSVFLGAAGMPGITAWYGINKILVPKKGETVVVSAASGAVGSVAGQLAKTRGARVVGLAGGAEKCRYVVEELGFDACIDYKLYEDAKSLSAALKEACPSGVDAYFENVGGITLDAVMFQANPFSRVAMCGMISGYNGAPIPMAAPQLILVNRMKFEGFIISEHFDIWPEALAELIPLLASNKLKYRESVAHGLENAPEAFLGLLKGRNFGKQLVKLIDAQ